MASIDVRGSDVRHVLTLLDLSHGELAELLQLAADLKAHPNSIIFGRKKDKKDEESPKPAKRKPYKRSGR